VIVVVMGVAGSGKTTVGRALAPLLGVPFIEGDDFHTASARERMAAGEPLTDGDRRPWIERLNGELRRHAAVGCVLACSALRRSYRRWLTDGVDGVVFVALVVSAAVLLARLAHRTDHFAHADLLISQLATLELGDDVIPIDGDAAVDVVLRDAMDAVETAEITDVVE
jgi:carbohydrate kinase (thermoresistant glucokinase family)